MGPLAGMSVSVDQVELSRTISSQMFSQSRWVRWPVEYCLLIASLHGASPILRGMGSCADFWQKRFGGLESGFDSGETTLVSQLVILHPASSVHVWIMRRFGVQGNSAFVKTRLAHGFSPSAPFCLSAPTQVLMEEAAVVEVGHRSAPGSGASEASSV